MPPVPLSAHATASLLSALHGACTIDEQPRVVPLRHERCQETADASERFLPSKAPRFFPFQPSLDTDLNRKEVFQTVYSGQVPGGTALAIRDRKRIHVLNNRIAVEQRLHAEEA